MTSAGLDHSRALVEAHLTAAWLRRCGPSGVPGEWFLPGEFLEVMDADVELAVYPTFATCREDGVPNGWSAHLRGPNHPEGWEWKVSAGWDEFSEEEVAALENLGWWMDERRTSFFVLGSHQQRPPVPVEVVKGLMLVQGSAP